MMPSLQDDCLLNFGYTVDCWHLQLGKGGSGIWLSDFTFLLNHRECPRYP